SREKREGSAVLLRIDGRVFQLIGAGRDAWAPDAAADAQIRDAMRTGVDMVVETRTARGALARDLYRLRRAATAMDAAAIACAPQREKNRTFAPTRPAMTTAMPIPGHIDPVPVPRPEPAAEGARVELVGLSKAEMREALAAAGLDEKQA